jgi:hypothetical protein
MLKIPLSTLQDVLAVADDGHFEQIVSELPDMLRSMRARTNLDGHAGFSWPIQWRPAGGPSTITSHFTDGETIKHQLDH